MSDTITKRATFGGYTVEITLDQDTWLRAELSNPRSHDRAEAQTEVCEAVKQALDTVHRVIYRTVSWGSIRFEQPTRPLATVG